MVLPIQVNETKSFEKYKIPQHNNVVIRHTIPYIYIYIYIYIIL